VFVAMAALFAGEAAAQSLSKDTTPTREPVTLYEEHPSDPAGRRLAGTAVWRTESVTSSNGQTAELAIQAEIEVPDRGLAMTLSIRRNTDRHLPASHVIDMTFKPSDDFPSGTVLKLPGILMKQGERVRGSPLAGIAVKVSEDFFLIGLSEVEADKERNLQMLWQRDWFDIPLVYSNGRRAILAIAKGAKAFDEAFAAWSGLNP
jgi:hypothetical protein